MRRDRAASFGSARTTGQAASAVLGPKAAAAAGETFATILFP